MTAIPRKKSIGEIDRALLVEPALTDEDWREYEEGWSLFNGGKFWEAHEKWESVWKRHHEESRIFFQGIIQLAAAYHLLLVKKRYGGMMNNFQKAEEKLEMFPERFLNVNVGSLLGAINQARNEARRIGATHLELFKPDLIPIVQILR